MAVTSPDGAYYPVAPGQGAEVSGLFSSRNVFVQYALRRSRDRPRAESELTCSPISDTDTDPSPSPMPPNAHESSVLAALRPVRVRGLLERNDEKKPISRQGHEVPGCRLQGAFVRIRARLGGPVGSGGPGGERRG